MSMRNLFGKWSGRRSSLTCNKKKSRARRGMCLRGEPLEERTLLSLSITPGVDYAVLANKDDFLPNVTRELVAVYQEHGRFLAAGGQRADFLSVRADEFRFEADRIYVEVRGRGDFNSFFTSVESFGFEPWYSSESALVVEGYLPLGQLRGIAEAENTLSLFPVWGFGQTDVGSVDNQAQDTLYTDFASGLFDVDGTGVSIGVMSDSVNQVGNGLADSVATGDLPPGIQVLIAGSPGNIDEGRAMLELIHDIAPGAALVFASGGNTDAAMATAINTLVTAGADIIVDDLNGLRSEPFFQDGLASEAVTAAVNGGVAYFSSAGNRGESGFESPVNFVQAQLAGITGNFHNFDLDGSTGVDVTQTVTLQPGRTDFVFQYDQPDGGVTSDLDIWVLDMNGNVVAAGQDDNLATQRPYETIAVNNPNPFPVQAQIAVRLFAGAAPTRFKWIGFNDPAVGEYDNEPGALVNPHNPGHSGNVNAMSTGAAAWFNPTVPRTFSSLGPVTRTLDVNGNPIPLQTINKPDITSHDGVNNTFFGQDIPEDPDIFPNFSGTSAAAPNAAAVAALLLDFDATLTPAGVRTVLTNSAIDIHDAGYDLKTGYGLIHSVDALLYLTGGVLVINGDRDGPYEPDTIIIQENSSDTSLIDVTLNWELLGSVAKASLTGVEIDGLSGNDTVYVYDLGSGFQSGFELYVYGGTGTDQVTISGSSGDDTFELYYGQATMSNSSWTCTAQGFEEVRIHSSEGNDYTDIYWNGLGTHLVLDLLVWDEDGDGDWTDADGNGVTRWENWTGGSTETYPHHSFTSVVIETDTVTVESNRQVKNLHVKSGAIAVEQGAELSLTGDLDIDTSAEYVCHLGGGTIGLIDAAGNVTLGANSTLTFQAHGPDKFADDTFTLLEAGGFTGTFGDVDNLNVYVSVGTNGVVYTSNTITLTLDDDLWWADPNFDNICDVRDFNIWNANKFTSPTIYRTGDFNDDTITDVRDFNIWNAHKFSSGIEERLGGGGSEVTPVIDVAYNARTGKLTVNTLGNPPESLVIEGPEAKRIDRWTDKERDAVWVQDYYAGAEQWARISGDLEEGTYRIATYPAGLSAADFGTVEYFAAGGIYTTKVRIISPNAQTEAALDEAFQQETATADLALAGAVLQAIDQSTQNQSSPEGGSTAEQVVDQLLAAAWL